MKSLKRSMLIPFAAALLVLSQLAGMGGSLAYQVQNQGGSGQGADAFQPEVPAVPFVPEAPVPSAGNPRKQAPAAQPLREGGIYGCNEEQNTSLDVSKCVDPVSPPGCVLTLEKSASTSYIEMWEGESAPLTFTIDVGVATSNSYNISGKIYVQNTGSWPADVTAVSDTVWYKDGGSAWKAAATSVTTTVPTGNNAISTGWHTYTYSGTFTLPVPLGSVTALSNYIQITISNHPNDGTHTFSYRKDFAKPAGGGGTLSLSDVEGVTPSVGLSYVTDSVTINGAPVSPTGPWTLNPAQQPFKVVIKQTVTGNEAGLYLLNNQAQVCDLCDDVDVEILVKERPPGKITGIKFDDLDCDGLRDANEPGLPGVLIVLWKDLVPVGSQLSDANGCFEFGGLCPGDYKVVEMGAPGYYPSTCPYALVSLDWGETKNVEFGNARYGKVGGYKFEDSDGDSVWDSDEPAVEGWEITLDGEETVETGADGWFEFSGLECGKHLVSEKAREGWFNTTPDEVEVEVGCGGGARVVFGNCRYGSISGTKYEDSDGSGTISSGDAPVAGVTIELWKGAVLVATTLTGADGGYSFAGLVPGGYAVEEVLPDGTYAVTPVTVGLTLASGDAATADFLNCRYGKISGYKFEDLNGNGEWDQGEPAVGGWEITLNGEETVETDASGYFEFSELECGEYLVSEEAREGWFATTPDEVNVELGCGGRAVFGNCRYGSISGTKYEDTDDSGTISAGDAPVAGVTIQLWQGDLLVAETVTDADGGYSFSGLTPGDYTVEEVLPDGSYAVTPVTVGLTLASGDAATADFLNCRYGSISGTKWDDPNGDGVHQAGEVGVPNVAITLSREGAVLATVKTSADGTYSFGALEPGTYEVAETLPSGSTNTTPVKVTVVVAPGQAVTGIDFLNLTVAGEIVTPPVTPAPPEAETTEGGAQLPLTGFGLLSWMLAAGLLMMLGLLILALGLALSRR